ncbi:class I SAM-dependent methyltransferase [Zobellella denitrificans]
MTALHCPLCSHSHLDSLLQRSGVPVHQNLLVADADAARQVTQGELDMRVCRDCGFVFNAAFDPAKLDYGQDYDNTQTHSAYFDDYLNDLVEHLVQDRGVRQHTIVEVGCGKGGFLTKLLTWPGTDNRGIGFDPSYVGPPTALDGRLHFHRRFYDESCADTPAEVVICRHVIEHVPDPLALLRSVRSALAAAPDARVFFETPCIEWILRHQVVWDFFYEHCSLFSADSLRLAFELAGFRVERVRRVFNEQYLWLEAKPVAPGESPSLPRTDTTELASAYRHQEQALLACWHQRITALKASGPVALWGAGAKGATLANLIDPEARLIDCVVDLNPNKQGRYLPGSGHPIVAPEALPARNIRHAVLMNPNYRAENQALLKQSGIKVNLIDWSES